ncbi:FHA domain-containing protein [Mycobacterium sp. NPDC051804]|uniref:FHA domain-containing protein n=1 Tax=Mycobacterium sp. NPDC051804 TaxID=3364295 RepID=UPI00378F41F3
MLPSQSPRDELGLPIVIVRFGRVDEVLRPGDGPVFIGRELPAQLRIDDTRISRTHARIESVGTQWVVVDEGSTNGVFLDGERVSTVSVTDGMTLYLGHAEGIAVRFSFIDPDAGTMMATGVMSARTTDDTIRHPDSSTAGEDPEDGLDTARAGEAVTARREELGYSARRLSDESGVSVDELDDLERGRNWPPAATREKIERALRWPSGTIPLVARGGEVPDDEDTGTLSDSVQLEVMLDYAKIALDGMAARIAALPPAGDPGFGVQVAELLAQLRRLHITTANAARSAPALEILLSLSDVRRTYSDLMCRAATAPAATLGQRLYAARHQALLSVEETAAATGIDVDAVNAVEAERAVSAEISAAVENVLLRLTNR